MKKFIVTILLFCAPIMAIFAPISIYYFAYVRSTQSGDLEKFGGVVISHDNQITEFPVLDERFYINLFDIYDETDTKLVLDNNIRYLNIGDSFSDQGDCGYVNFLGHYLDKHILNISTIVDPFKIATSLLNNNYIDNAQIDVVIIESVERHIVNRVLHCDNQDETDIRLFNRELKQNKKRIEQRDKQRDVMSHFKELTNWMMIQIKPKSNLILSARLDTTMFSHATDNLYFYHEDVKGLSMNEETLTKVEQCLMDIKRQFEERGIQLFVMCIPDKYSLYQDRVVSNKYGRKEVLNQFSEIEGIKEFFYNAKKPLLPMVQQGVKDVYLYNDTHWSPIASQVIGKDLARFIKAKQREGGDISSN